MYTRCRRCGDALIHKEDLVDGLCSVKEKRCLSYFQAWAEENGHSQHAGITPTPQREEVIKLWLASGAGGSPQFPLPRKKDRYA